MLETINDWDHMILYFIQEHLRSGWLTVIMKYITMLSGVFWIISAIILICFQQTRKMGLQSLVSLLICAVIVHLVLKPGVARIRPYEYFTDLQALIAFPRDFSFPSGHSASAFAAIGAYMNIDNTYIKIFLVVLAFLIAFSRLYVGVHYPSDVIVGIIIGCLCSFGTHLIFTNIL